MLASLSLSLSFASPLTPPKIPDTFTAVITSDTSGTSSAVPKGKATMKQFCEWLGSTPARCGPNARPSLALVLLLCNGPNARPSLSHAHPLPPLSQTTIPTSAFARMPTTARPRSTGTT